jgi:hypothetical protein
MRSDSDSVQPQSVDYDKAPAERYIGGLESARNSLMRSNEAVVGYNQKKKKKKKESKWLQ